MEFTDAEILESLESEICPACKGIKAKRNALCVSDYNRLPYGLRMSLYRRVGKGYEDAFREVMECLEQQGAVKTNVAA